MILQYDELGNYGRKVVMTDGCFDPLHIGHIRYFEAAARSGLPVFCNVQSDGYIIASKNRPGILPEDQRIKVINAINNVSYVHLCKTTTHDVLERLTPLKYVKGLDWKKRGLPEIEKKICARLGIEIVYLDTNLDSSTNIVGNFASALFDRYNAVSLKEFEKILFSQKTVDARNYDNHYFEGEWRGGGNNYSIESRRAIEAKNPANIKEIFNPRCVLDVGCGPGALMYFLYELGVESYGIDFSKAAKELAPAEVSPRIACAPVTEYYDFKKEFDLVLCRELLEHLTVLQIMQTVKVLARYTTRYLYITTRYHPSPKGLLDVTDDAATDPTHVTLLNKDFLKLLFMIEGLTPRPDLEEKMDWRNLGRVLVFERRG